jgi:hypothetical protein
MTLAVIFAMIFTGCKSSSNDKIVGKWQLDKVFAAEKGLMSIEMSKEDHQSLYANNGIYTFNEDGTASYTLIEAGEEYITEAKWVRADTNVYEYTDADGTTIFRYNDGDDTIEYEYNATSPDEPYVNVKYILTKVK